MSFDLILLSGRLDARFPTRPAARLCANSLIAQAWCKIIILLKFGMTVQEQQQRQMYDVKC